MRACTLCNKIRVQRFGPRGNINKQNDFHENSAVKLKQYIRSIRDESPWKLLNSWDTAENVCSVN